MRESPLAAKQKSTRTASTTLFPSGAFRQRNDGGLLDAVTAASTFGAILSTSPPLRLRRADPEERSNATRSSAGSARDLERETGLEPATFSLEGRGT